MIPEPTLPTRRVLVLVNDGKDNDEAGQKKRIDALIDLAATLGLKLDVLGLTLDQPEPLVTLEMLAARAGGSYRNIPFEELKQFPSQIADAGRAIGAQLVIDIKPQAAIWGKANLRFELTSADGKVSVKRVVEGVKLPDRATP